MSADVGRKVQVQVMMTQRLLEKIDAIAAKEKKEDEREPNRSRVIRRLVSNGIELEEKGSDQ